jgi:pseudaminic acid biosynthesis-associated methylase
MKRNEEFWKGDFGNEYAKRNVGKVEANIALFARIMTMTDGVESVLELGCGTGQNLQALHTIMPSLTLIGVEINEAAARACKVGEIHQRSILDPALQVTCDMAMTKGLLIHIPPEELPAVYRRLYTSARRYILVAEYYSPTRVEVPYRGHAGTLWKADFAGELMDAYSDLRLVDVGFAYHRSPFPQDDVTWMLLERRDGQC